MGIFSSQRSDDRKNTSPPTHPQRKAVRPGAPSADASNNPGATHASPAMPNLGNASICKAPAPAARARRGPSPRCHSQRRMNFFKAPRACLNRRAPRNIASQWVGFLALRGTRAVQARNVWCAQDSTRQPVRCAATARRDCSQLDQFHLTVCPPLPIAPAAVVVGDREVSGEGYEGKDCRTPSSCLL